jgi:MFS family permease
VNKKADEYSNIELEETTGGGGGISLRSLRTFDSFKNPVFRLYYGSMLGEWSSMNMQQVARSLLIYRITGSGAILGAMSLAHAIPNLFLSLLGGVIADRLQKKYILLVGQVGAIILSLGIALTLTLGYLGPERPNSWWILVVAAVLQGILMGLIMPSRQAIIPEIVGEKQLMNAISLTNVGMNTFQIVAPAMTGFIIDAFSFQAVYYTATVMYLISTLCIILMPTTRGATVRGSSALADIFEGLRYIRYEKILLTILAFHIFGIICGMPFMFLMPIFTEDVLKVGASGLGIIMSVAGAGALTGSLVIAYMPNRKRGLMWLFGSLIRGLALVFFSFSGLWYLSLPLVFFIGLGQSANMTLGNTLIQYYADADYRGRVMSFHMMGSGFASFGTFFAGMLSDSIGVQWSIGGMAMLFILASFTMLTATPRLRKLD